MTRRPRAWRRAIVAALPVVPVVLAFFAGAPACGGGARQVHVGAAVPASSPTLGTSSAHTSASAPQPLPPDFPPPGEPRPLTPARVVALKTKVPVKAIGVISPKLPIVYCRVAVLAGNATASIMGTGRASKAGIAELTASLLRDGGAGRYGSRALADRIDALGTELTVDVTADRAVLGMAVTKDKLDDALELLSAVVLHPRLDPAELTKLKARALDGVRQAERADGGWIARQAMYRELFGAGHPYAEVAATDVSLARVQLADVKSFYERAYVAASTTIVLAGDFDETDVAARLDTYFAGFPTRPAPEVVYPEPPVPSVTGATRVVLATKAEAKQADIFIGRLSVPRRDPRWPELSIALQALGEGLTSRLFRDVRETRSLAYSTGASARELAHAPAPVALFAGTQVPLAVQSVSALLEHLRDFGSARPITSEELSVAKTSLESSFVFRLETIGAVGGLAVDKEVLQLPGSDVYDYVAHYRRSVHDADLSAVRTVASRALKDEGVVIAVAGGPSLAAPLSRFGEVRVVDPEKDFATVGHAPFDAGRPAVPAAAPR